jgi:hypothetical protein
MAFDWYDPDDLTTPSIVTTDYDTYDKYKKLKISSAYKFGFIYHQETECGQYLWLEINAGKIVLSMEETFIEMGYNAEIAAAYHSGRPSYKQVAAHFEWKVDDENIWDD